MRRILEIIKKVKSIKYFDLYLLILLLILAVSIYSFMAITLHNHFLTFGLDLGNFDEILWKISKGKFAYSGVGCNWLIEDHFQPILFLVAPLFWIWDNVRVILIYQSFAMILAGLPLYLLAKKITKQVVFSFAVVFAYLFFIGTQFAILNEFHQITIAPLFIAWAYYALEKKNIRYFIYAMIGLLITKEDLSLLVASIGVGLIFTKSYKKLGIATALFGIFCFFFLIYIFMPAISIKGVYDHFDFGSVGFTPVDVLKKSLTDPVFILRSMLTPAVKIKTLFQSFSSFAFLPFFSPLVYLIPLVQDFFVRFIYSGPQYTKWGLVNHHAATGAILLSIATIYAASRVHSHLMTTPKYRFYLILSILLFISTIGNDILFHGPVNSLGKRSFYQEEKWVKDNREVITHVPPSSSLAGQNNLLPHLTHRDNIYRIPFGLNSEYMIFDLHDGPNKYSPLNFQETKKFVNDLLNSGRYSLIYQRGDALLLKRNYKTDITKSKYYGDTRYCYYSYEER